MTIDITQIVVAVIGLISLVLTGIAIPLIRAKVGEKQWADITKWAIAGVKAAEVLFEGTGLGEQKREYVMNFIREQCKKNGITFDETAARIALEDAWDDLIGSVTKEAKNKNLN